MMSRIALLACLFYFLDSPVAWEVEDYYIGHFGVGGARTGITTYEHEVPRSFLFPCVFFSVSSLPISLERVFFFSLLRIASKVFKGVHHLSPCMTQHASAALVCM